MTGTDLNAVYEHLLGLVGLQQFHDFGVMSALAFGRFATASTDYNPRYFDIDVAREQSFEERPAPPMFLSSVFGWDAGPEQEQLRSDGAGADRHEGMDLAGLRLMGAGQDIEFLEPLYPGAHVVATSSLDAVELKHGRSGDFLVITLLWRYTRQDGAVLSTNRERLIARQAA